MTKLLMPYGSSRYLGTRANDGAKRTDILNKLGGPKSSMVTKVGTMKSSAPAMLVVRRKGAAA